MSELVNRVAQSGLITIDLETLYREVAVADFDLKDYLFQGLVLREKDFREALAAHDWTQYADQVLLIHCTADAIIPAWAPMLVASLAIPYAADVFHGDRDSYLTSAFRHAIEAMEIDQYVDARIVVKGCSGRSVPQAAYLELVKRLQPVVRSLMFGEPCSTVPVFKKGK